MIRSMLGGMVAFMLVVGSADVSCADGHGMNKHDSHETHGMLKSVKVESAWARASAGKARNGVAYVSIENEGRAADRLVGAKSDIAKRTEIHTHLEENGVMKMRRVDGIDLPAGGKITMRPGGYHVMFMGLNKPLKKGGKFSVRLVFEKAGEVTAEVTVQGVGAMMGGGGHGAHGDGMKEKAGEMKEGMGGRKH